MTKRGKYIVLEGTDGTGKSTQIKLLGESLSAIGIESIELNEPEGVPLASALRDTIKNGLLPRDAWTNVMLFTAARRVNNLQSIQPALERGLWVLSARNWYSTLVYQGNGEGIPEQKIIDYTESNVGPNYMVPDLALILTMNKLAARKTRISQRGELSNPDTFESMSDDFQERIDAGYLDFSKRRRIKTIDVSQSREQVQSDLWVQVQTLLS